MSNPSFSEWVEAQRRRTRKLPASIEERWQGRIVKQGLDKRGAAGATDYLARYGKSIGAEKCVHLAIRAEIARQDDMARRFWQEAYFLAVGKLPGVYDELNSPDPKPAPKAEPKSSFADIELGAILDFPEEQQPGALVPMQPVDARNDRDLYITEDYWGQPKRDGEKLIVFATLSAVWYQSRSLKLQAAPDAYLDEGLKKAAAKLGSFILEGELFYLDMEGNEHQNAALAAAANDFAGEPEVQPLLRFSAFSCLYLRGVTFANYGEQVDRGADIMREVAWTAPDQAEVIPTCKTQEEKAELVKSQQKAGREGEVWFMPSMRYLAGKHKDERFVRTKYLTDPTEYVVTDVFPAKAEGHTIGGFAIATLDGKPVGRVGTGYSRRDQQEILKRHQAAPGKLRVLVVSQKFTVYGKAKMARFMGFVE